MENEDLDQQDPLISQLASVLPQASPEELQSHANEIRSRAPGISDDQLVQMTGGAGQQAKDRQVSNDYVKNKYQLGDQYSDENRQKIVDQNTADASGPSWLAGLGALGAGIAGGNAIGAGQAILGQQKAQREGQLNQFDKSKALAMQDIDYKQGQDKFARESDPNSDESKLAQDAAIKMGVDPAQASKLTAAKFKESGPIYEKIYQVAERAKASDAATQERALAAKERLASIAASNEGRKAIQDERKDKMMADQQDKDLRSLDSHLGKGWAARGGQAGQVQAKINSAEAAETLIEQGRKQPGGLDSRQIEELAQSTAKLLGGGATASGRVEALVPHTWTGRAQSLKEFITNEPNGQQMQKFVDRMAETVAREKELAQNQQKQYQVSGLASFDRLKKSNPEMYSQILQAHGIDPSMIDEKGQYKKPQSSGNDGGANGMVRVKDPKGNIRQIPKDQVKNALAAGGTLADVSNMASEE